MAHDVNNVSKWFIQHNSDAAKPSFNGHIKLQKLLYYAQAMNLSLRDDVLFPNKIEAWENGPVVRDVFREYRHNDLVGNTFNKEEFDYTTVFDEQTIKILNVVNYIYGSQTGDQLIKLTHSEGPWKELEEQAINRKNPEIKIKRIKEYYESLKDLFDLYEDYDFSEETQEVFNSNVFVYNKNETALFDDDIRKLWQIGEEINGEKYFVYRDEDGELVVY